MGRGLRMGAGSGLAGLLLLGCASPFWGPPPVVEDTRVVAVSPDRALARGRSWFGAHGFVVERAQRTARGVRLVARRTPFEVGNRARCAWMFRMSGGVQPEALVTLSVEPASAGHSRVEAKTEISLVNAEGDRAQCASHGLLEREILGSLEGG